MPLSQLQETFLVTLSSNSYLSVLGTAGIQFPTRITQSYPFTTANTNASVLGSDEMYCLLTSIAASGNTTINLQSFTDICNQTAVSLVRCKAFFIQLLSTTQTAPDGTQGTACSSITVGGAAANPFPVNLVTAAGTFTVNNGSTYLYLDGSASGLTVSGAACNVKILNNDGANAAKVLVAFIGGTT